ncbi:FMRFamide peptide receptor frpr-18-like [Physella acuta]|uniref:FMRFamide peptide receptor frpr-18-like n=1 Tax=Physella acuta TaxID=109671 RepID=UPI0027DB65DB|nr:FMRFamide peptide receptor frpr-18-like [Physella acuta]
MTEMLIWTVNLNFTNYSKDLTSLPKVLSQNGYLPPVILDVFLTLNLLIGSDVISVFGIVGNIVNIIVYHHQGYDDSVNITLTALAVSDIGALVTLIVFNVMINPWLLKSDVTFQPVEIAYMTMFYPHNYFIRVCGFITAFASFERCLCVLIPLKVKRVITKQRTITIIVAIYIILLLDFVPIYYVAYIDFNFNVVKNKSILGLIFRENPYNVFSISYYFTDLFVPYFTFFVIIVCTIIIAIKLKTRATWRKSVTRTTTTTTVVSSKEQKTVVMLMVVSVIFVVCLLPQSAILTTISSVPELSVVGAYLDLTLLLLSVAFFAETISSSVNVVVYYKMSSRYRETLLTLMHVFRQKYQKK